MSRTRTSREVIADLHQLSFLIQEAVERGDEAVVAALLSRAQELQQELAALDALGGTARKRGRSSSY